jgi:hypothetical protein
MRHYRAIRSLILLLPFLLGAKQQDPAELKARADAAHGGEQAKLCLEYAHAELEHANDLFTKGDVEQAQAAVNSVMEYVRKGTDAATTSGKRLKQTEIELRELEKRMKSIGDSLNLEDRPPVLKNVDEIEQLRSGLLAKMFGDKAEPKSKS